MGLLDGLLGHASEVDVAKVQDEFAPLLVQGEVIERAFKVIRDLLVFTDRRLILVDKQGLTGSKREYRTIPYARIVSFSKESAGVLDMDAELKIWLSGNAEPIVKEFGKDDNVNDVYALLSSHVL